jgi:hypothetical protein
MNYGRSIHNNGWNRQFGNGGAQIQNMSVNFNFGNKDPRNVVQDMFGSPLGQPSQKALSSKSQQDDMRILEFKEEDKKEKLQLTHNSHVEEAKFEVIEELNNDGESKCLYDFGPFYINEKFQLRTNKNKKYKVEEVSDCNYNDHVRIPRKFEEMEQHNIFHVDIEKIGTNYTKSAFVEFIKKIVKLGNVNHFFIVLYTPGDKAELDEPERMFNNSEVSVWKKEFLKITK